MDGSLVHTVGIQTRMSRYGYTRACIFFRILLLSCRKEEHDQSGRQGFLSVGCGGKRSMMCLLVALLVLGEERGR